MTVRSRWRHSRSRRAGSAGGFHLLNRDLVAFWNFEEPDGGPYADELPRATPLDWVEDLAVNVGKGEGRPGEGVTLIEGVQSELELSYAKLSAPGNEDVLLKTQDWTLSMWWFLESFTTVGTLFHTQAMQANTPGVQLRIAESTGTKLNLKVDDGTSAPQGYFAQALTLGAWNHIIIRHQHGGETEFVLNGAPAADTFDTSAATGTLDNGTWLWKLGSNTLSPTGTVDSVGIWSRLITDYECGLLYEGFTK